MESLTLRSRLPEMARLSGWIETLASRHAIPDRTQFAMSLCLEEALSNIIRHGYSGQPDGVITVTFEIKHRYSGQPDGVITVRFEQPREDYYVFDVEDEAPPFNPLDAPEPPAAQSLDEAALGGQGIRLLRRFADSLEHQATEKGNRLSIGFSAARSGVARS